MKWYNVKMEWVCECENPELECPGPIRRANIGHVAWDDVEVLWSYIGEELYVDSEDEARIVEWLSLPKDNIEQFLKTAYDAGFILYYELWYYEL